jgi:hypothetical protein
MAADNIDEFAVAIENNQIRIGKGGPLGVYESNPQQRIIAHSHAPGHGSPKPSPTDIASFPPGESEFWIDPQGRIHVIGRPPQ